MAYNQNHKINKTNTELENNKEKLNTIKNQKLIDTYFTFGKNNKPSSFKIIKDTGWKDHQFFDSGYTTDHYTNKAHAPSFECEFVIPKVLLPYISMQKFIKNLKEGYNLYTLDISYTTKIQILMKIADIDNINAKYRIRDIISFWVRYPAGGLGYDTSVTFQYKYKLIVNNPYAYTGNQRISYDTIQSKS